ncbi:unnamed protein product [Echinostoma caproni]|uniref:Trafficking protein particle complex subunit 6B n=1 Tax=Echinostoma caproni TaxID=27848 RepID=A0A183B0G8_9TREM|nr:unnamed protein product [Echinostoma caproni]
MPSTAVHSYDAFDALLTEIVNYASESTANSIDSPTLCEQFLDSIGFTVSQRLIERTTKDHSRFANELDVVKYVCTEFWGSVFHKQVDTLKTNYQASELILVTLFLIVGYVRSFCIRILFIGTNCPWLSVSKRCGKSKNAMHSDILPHDQHSTWLFPQDCFVARYAALDLNVQ